MNARLGLVAALTSLIASTVGVGAASADSAPSCVISISNVRLADVVANVQPKTTNSLVFAWTGSATGCTSPVSVSAELRQVGDPSSVEGLTNSDLNLNGPTVFDGLTAGHSYILTVSATDGIVGTSASSAAVTTLRGLADVVKFTPATKAGARPGFVQIAGTATDSGYPISDRATTLWIAPLTGGAAKLVATSRTDFAGAFNFWARIAQNSRVTVRVDGISTPERIINVAYRISVRSTTATIRTKKAAIITATVSPARRVLVNLYRANGKSWTLVTKGYASAKGIVKFSVKPKKTTNYRVVVRSDSRNTTAAETIAVRVR
jgi:hypothetical protein